MLIRKNTKAFKTILEIVVSCQDRPDREKLIRLYITKAGHTVRDRISIAGIEHESALFYEMNYQAVLNNLKSANHQLHESEEFPGLYFFHSASNKVWDETPFEFDGLVGKEFASLPDLPTQRKKESPEKYTLPTPGSSRASKGGPSKAEQPAKVKKPEEKKPKQPNFKLRQEIEFSDLEKVVFRQPKLVKKDLLDYYNAVAECMIPRMEKRPLSLLFRDDRRARNGYTTIQEMKKKMGEIPGWVQSARASKKNPDDGLVTCNDREHLLLLVESGALGFSGAPTRISAKGPDCFVIALDSPDFDVSKAVDVAQATREILDGLKLPSYVMTDGRSGFYVYVPLDGKSEIGSNVSAAEFICKLIRLKIPNLVEIEGDTEADYGKVLVDFRLNGGDSGIIIPYSLVEGDAPVVATPLRWTEVRPGLRLDDFDPSTVLARLKKNGDPFEDVSGKKANANELVARLEEQYSFLL